MTSIRPEKARILPAAHLLMSTVVIVLALVLASPAVVANTRQWSIALTGPDRVTADRAYAYTVTLTNDGGEWPTSGRAEPSLRLSLDLRERYGEGTVGIEDILIHPVGPQAADGSFPCDTQGGCWFRRSGSRIDFSFTRENVRVGPVSFDVIVHTASVFRAGDSFRLSASVQDGRSEPSDGTASLPALDGSMSAAIVATFPLACRDTTSECLTPSFR